MTRFQNGRGSVKRNVGCREWEHAELGLVREATLAEVMAYYAKTPAAPVLFQALPPDGDRSVLVRMVHKPLRPQEQ